MEIESSREWSQLKEIENGKEWEIANLIVFPH
jgi:hypothetical protein